MTPTDESGPLPHASPTTEAGQPGSLPRAMPDDLLGALTLEDRPGTPERPWVFSNMITSLDGSAAIDGLSSKLGGPSDLALLLGLRAMASALLVGSTNVANEGYRVPDPSPEIAAVRVAAGLDQRMTIAIVSASLTISTDAPVFADPTYRPLILTTRSAPSEGKRRLDDVADIVECGHQQVDLAKAVAKLGRRGHGRVLVEGGPTLNGGVVEADLLDEWNMTISPLLVGGPAPRAAHGASQSEPRSFDLERLWLQDGLLFGRWLHERHRSS